MIISVASGKGGTGKTTVAVGLALSLLECPPPGVSSVTLIDCDVEAPNAALFLRPSLGPEETVDLLVPQVDAAACTLCGRCAEVCQYHALAVVGDKVLVFEDLCHGCGSCTLICPEGAISGKKKERHTIDPEKCIKCGACRAVCAFGAIEVA